MTEPSFQLCDWGITLRHCKYSIYHQTFNVFTYLYLYAYRLLFYPIDCALLLLNLLKLPSSLQSGFYALYLIPLFLALLNVWHSGVYRLLPSFSHQTLESIILPRNPGMS